MSTPSAQSVSSLNPRIVTIQRNVSLPVPRASCCIQSAGIDDCSNGQVLTAGSVTSTGFGLSCVAIVPGQVVLGLADTATVVVDPPGPSLWTPSSVAPDEVKRQEQSNVVFPLIVLGVLAGVFLFSWLLSLLLDKRRITDTQALREALYLRMGGGGAAAAHMAPPHENHSPGVSSGVSRPVAASAIKSTAAAKRDVQHHIQQLRKAQHASMVGMLLSHLAHTSKAFILERHAWFAVFARIPPHSTSPRRAQRIAQLAVMCVTAMAVCAVYYGADLRSLSGQAITAVMAAAVLIPLEVVFPVVFAQLNRLPTRLLRSKLHEEYQRRKRQQRRRARRLRYKIPLAQGSPDTPQSSLQLAAATSVAALAVQESTLPGSLAASPVKQPTGSTSGSTSRSSLGSGSVGLVQRGGLQIQIPSELGQASHPDTDVVGISHRDWGLFANSGSSVGSSTTSSPGYLSDGGRRMNFSATVAPNQLADVQRVLETLNLASKVGGRRVPADHSGRISIATVESDAFSSGADSDGGFMDDGELFGQLAVGHLLDMVGRAAGDASLAAGNFDLGHVRSMKDPVSGRRRLIVSGAQMSPGSSLSTAQRTMVVDITPQAADQKGAVEVAARMDSDTSDSALTEQDAFFVGAPQATPAHNASSGALPASTREAPSTAKQSGSSEEDSSLAWLQAYAALGPEPKAHAVQPRESTAAGCRFDEVAADAVGEGDEMVQFSRADTFSSIASFTEEALEHSSFPSPPRATTSTAASLSWVVSGAGSAQDDGRDSSQQSGHAHHASTDIPAQPIRGILKRSTTQAFQAEQPTRSERMSEVPLTLQTQVNSRPRVPRLPAAKRRQQAKIAAHRAAQRCIRCRSFLAVASLIQVWAGIAGVALAVFLFSGLYRPEVQDVLPNVAVAECPVAGCDANATEPTVSQEAALAGLSSDELASVGTFAVGFAVLIVLGILGNMAARWNASRSNCGCREAGASSACASGFLWLLAVSMEAATAVWMVLRNMPFAMEGIALVVSMQAVPFGVAVAAAVVLRLAGGPGAQQQVHVAQGQALDDTVTVPQDQQEKLLQELGGSQAALAAVLRVQAVFRGQLGRARAARARELAAWNSLGWQRWSLQCIVYFVMLTALAAGVYALLLFGSRFTLAQGVAWARAVFLAFLFDVCIQQPVLAFLWVSGQFVSQACRRPAHIVILERLASNARAAQVLYEAAVIRDGRGADDTPRGRREQLPHMQHLNSQQLLTINAALAPKRGGAASTPEGR